MLVEVNNNYYYRFVFDKQHYGKSKEYFALRKMQVPFSMPIGASANVLSNSCALHGNSTIEIRGRNRVRMQADILEIKIGNAGTKEKESRRPNCLSGLPYTVVTASRSSK